MVRVAKTHPKSSARHKIQNLFKSQLPIFKRLMVAFYWMSKSDFLARSAVTLHNHKLRTKPFWRHHDQVIRTWSWSMGRQNTPLV